jgi:hypothetical protein
MVDGERNRYKRRSIEDEFSVILLAMKCLKHLRLKIKNRNNAN